MTDQAELDFSGEALRDAGIARVLDHTPESWKNAALEAITSLATSGRGFTAEDVREIAGDPPGHYNAMGAAVRAAATRGLIRKVGFTKATRASLHATELALWVGTRRGGALGTTEAH